MITHLASVAYANRSTLVALLMMFSIGGCDAGSDTTRDASTPEVNNAQFWQGESRGYVTQGDPTQNEVDLLVYLGHVHAAVGRANDHQKEDGMINPFTPKVMAEYAVIDPIVAGLDRKDLSLYPLLTQVASAETFATIVDPSREQRMERNAIHRQLVTLIGRLDSIVTELFPSTRSSALAMSALVREAGALLRTGLSADGQILNEAPYRDALRLMDAALRLRVNKVLSCRVSREAYDQLKHQGPLGELLDRFIIVSDSGLVGANAGDAFAMAESLSALGASLPADDDQICH